MKKTTFLGVILMAFTAATELSAQQSENFTTSGGAAADGWIGYNNTRSGTNDFGAAYTVNYGWSSTAYIGDPSGEAGGVFQNPAFNSYYADVFPNSGALSITNAISAHGKYVLHTQATNMNIYIGHFLTTSLSGAHPNNGAIFCQMGLGIAEYNPSAGGNGRLYAYVNYGDGTSTRSPNSGTSPLVATVLGQTYNWGYTFTPTVPPTAGNYGVLALSVTNASTLVVKSTTITLSDTNAAHMTFDAFGIAQYGFPASTNPANNEENPDPGEAYIDSVTYTVPPFSPPPTQCVSASPGAISIAQGSSNQSVAVTIPSTMNATQNAAVTVTSQNPAIATPVGAVNGSLTLQFPSGGTNTQSFTVSALSTGNTSFVLSDTNNVCVTNSVAVTVFNQTSGTFVKNQTFDNSNSATAGGWIGYNNNASGTGSSGTPYTVNFGFSPTAYAGPAGEAGGVFQNPGFPAYYADVFDVGQTVDPDVLSITNTIVANGQFILKTQATNMNVFIGHFLASSLSSGNGLVQIGFGLAEPNPSLGGNGRFYPYVYYPDGTFNRGGNTPLFAPVTNQVYNWGYVLNPTGGSGHGTLTVNVTNATTLQTYSSTLTLSASAAGMTFDAFGIAQPSFSSTEIGPDPGEAYIDNVSYTAPVPQPPMLQFQVASSANLESVSPILVNVTLSRTSTQTVTVNYAITGGTATNGVDYTLSSGVLTFNPGQTNQTISIPILNDASNGNESTSETIVLTLSSPTGGAQIGSTSSFTYTIVNPLPLPLLTATVSGDNVILSWPAVLSYYQVQARPDLTQPPGWTNLPNPVNVVNNQRQVVMPTTGDKQFFRLVPALPPVFTNYIGMVFLQIAPGTFTMGSGTNFTMADNGSLDFDEQPAHSVTLSKQFYMLNSTVSQSQYAQSGLPGSATDVSWNNAAAFCSWLSQLENLNYRLPTEAEWNYIYQNRQGVGGFSGPEWVQDWHWIYSDDSVTDPLGPSAGLCKVIRTDAVNRFTEPPDATSLPWGFNATAFRVVLVVDAPTNPFVGPTPLNFGAVKQSTAPALQGPNPALPYFTVRFAMPIPPVNDTNNDGGLTGLDPAVPEYNHSPGFTILPNGDALAIYFSAPNGNENTAITRFCQARLRYGAEEWDMPELFWDLKNFNDQSAMLWTDGNTVRYFGGGRLESGIGQQFNPQWMPFKMAVSTDNGATWMMSLPLLDAAANDYTPQPITSGFRGPDGSMYFAMDAAVNNSFLWRSQDNGITWHDMGGRTGGRHSQIVPLDTAGNLVSYGGKNTSINGYMPMNTSSNWGASWSASVQTPFAPLGGGQRPCLIKLADGNLLLVGDSVISGTYTTPPGWTHGTAPYVALSSNNGATWQFKSLPVTSPEDYYQGSSHTKDAYGTLGYATVRQAPNGVIHLLTSLTYPNLHYEFNEAWLNSTNGDMVPESTGGSIQSYSENYPSGALHATWSGRICPNGRYLLDGLETTYYENGQMERQVTWTSGRRTGAETWWSPNGTKLVSWTHDPVGNNSTWIHWYNNGRMRVQSVWNTNPTAPDVNRVFRGLVANGPAYGWNRDGSPAYAYNFVNGINTGALALPPAQP